MLCLRCASDGVLGSLLADAVADGRGDYQELQNILDANEKAAWRAFSIALCRERSR